MYNSYMHIQDVDNNTHNDLIIKDIKNYPPLLTRTEIPIYYIIIFKTIQCLAANIKFYLVNATMFNEIQCSCANSKFYLVNASAGTR